MHPSSPARRSASARTVLVSGILALSAVLAGCSGGSESDTAAMDAGGGQAESAAEQAAPRAASGADTRAAGRAAGGTAGATQLLTPQTRAVIRTGTISLVTEDLAEARVAIDTLLSRYGGYVAQEETSNDEKGDPAYSRLRMRFPAADFDTVMSELGTIGRREESQTDSDDVTTEVIDVNTRVATQEASLDRLQKFLGRAQDIDDVIALESEIAKRQAALESLKGQQEYLADQTAQSTITVRLSTPEAYVEPPGALDDAGFLAGLQSGWNALRIAAVGALTVVGAVLPFAVALVMVGIPGWLLLRALLRRRRAPAAPGATPDAPA
jgi:hypothetical protein